MPKKIIIAVGGSGGHLLPAQVLASEMKAEVLFAGAGLDGNIFFDKKRSSFKEISSSSSPIKGSFNILKGVAESFKLFREFKPDMVVGIGSWHSAPVLLAAIIRRIPIVLYSPDTVPSLVTRLFAPFAKWTGISFIDALRYIKGPFKLVAWPLRNAIKQRPSRQDAFIYYGLDPSQKTVLVFGGSQGAQSLNSLIKNALADLPVQVIHLCGPHEDEKSLRAFYGSRAVVKSYETQMGFAWSAADIVICRSGASTLAEQFYYAVPALYLPYPYASDKHQLINALYAKTIGGGEVSEESRIVGEELSQKIKNLLENPEQYKRAIERQRLVCPQLSLSEEIMK
ncbi:MAG: UDP-N-acetylglucosamine--N-acetylmuramyl-(pentapeptide) pyrophosphoryl-undecaprenol N-acetylglucosamine transferase [Chlamydiae bacterium]|nr:UDP-N-acetylglucosamine--N-acetylmuramyl-(pentapeptide) pyrophosphoryl-undecaprenol N-acetylglucosamine transferase [Chlamydiota bacterium]